MIKAKKDHTRPVLKIVIGFLTGAMVLVLSVSFLHAESVEELGRKAKYYEVLEKDGYIPEAGLIPDAETAIKIAEAIWLPIYGNGVLDKKPFVAVLVGDYWFVYGTFHQDPRPGVGSFGGVPYTRIRKSDGKVLGVTHTL